MAQNSIDEFDLHITTARRDRRLKSRHVDTPDLDNDKTMNDPQNNLEDDAYRPEIKTDIPDNAPREPFTGRRRPAHITDNRPGVIKFFCDRRLHIFFACLCLILGTVMALMLLSHMRNGGADQSRAINLSVEQIAASDTPVNNVGGAFGAWLSQVLFTDSLGIGSIAIALYLIIMGVNILRRRPLEFWSLTFKTLLVVLTLSVVLGLLTYNTAMETSWGGTHGHAVTRYLLSTTGPIGPIAIAITLIIAVICVYLNDIVRLINKWKAHRRAVAESKAHNVVSPISDVPAATDRPIIEPELRDVNNMVSDTDDDEDENLRDEVITDNEPYDQDNNDDASHEESVSSHPITSRMSEDDRYIFNIDDDNESKGAASDNTFDKEFTVEAPEADTGSLTGQVTNQAPSDHRATLSRYSFPSLELLADRPIRTTVDMDEQQRNKDRIVKALADKKITIASIKATVGPTVTLFEIVPTEDVRVAQIKRLEDDIAMSLSARGIRIIAPLPGKGTVGIEVPNSDPQTVSMRQVLASKKFREYNKPLPVALGATISNEIFVADLSSMPHVLVAGATGQGKSVGLNAIIASLLYKKHPSELKFVLIDPKEVEFSLYAKLEKHYLATLPGMDDEDESPIITSHERVLATLNSLCVLMDRRYRLLRKAGVRNIIEYNTKFADHRLNPENGHEFMPYIVVIIDEFADLIMTAGKEIELPVQRITQKARAVGIHMVIATQRPSTNVLTGLIKANCPTRIAFRVMQMVDSRTILDRPGANQLIGKGDMLYSNGGEVERVQCAFISTEEVETICQFIGDQIGYETPYYLPEPLAAIEDNNTGRSHATAPGAERDSLFEEAARFIITQSTASTSSLQRRYQIGYNRAGKIMDQLEAAGVVSPASGSKPRNILVDGPTLELILEQSN